LWKIHVLLNVLKTFLVLILIESFLDSWIFNLIILDSWFLKLKSWNSFSWAFCYHQNSLNQSWFNIMKLASIATTSSSSAATSFLFLVTTTLHSSLGFFSVFAPKLLDVFSANFLVSWPTKISRFFRADSVLLWLDMVTCMNWARVSSRLVVLWKILGPCWKVHRGPYWIDYQGVIFIVLADCRDLAGNLRILVGCILAFVDFPCN